MAAKSQQLQIRVTPEQKSALRRHARRAGLDVSSYVLARAMPAPRLRFDELLQALRSDEERRFALAEINDLLASLPTGTFQETVTDAEPRGLSPYLQNYVAAMVEQAAQQKSVAPPSWTRAVEPLAEPHFATPLVSLRLHLLRSAPVPFKRRNIFVDSGVGARV